MPQTGGNTRIIAMKTARRPLSLDLQFMIAIAGTIVSFWMASRQDVHKLPPLPSFHDRFFAVAPSLAEGAAGIIFAVWLALLWRKAQARATPRLITTETVAETAKKKRWTAFKWATFVVFVVATIASFGGVYISYLWPSYPAWISHSAHYIFDLSGLLGFFLESYNRRKKQTPQPGTGFGTERTPWLDEKQKAFIFATLVGIALLIGIFHAIKGLPASSVKQIMTICVLVVVAVQATIMHAVRKTEKNPHQSDIQGRILDAGEGRPRQRKWLTNIFVWVIVTAIIVTLSFPLPPQIKAAVVLVPIGLLVVWSVTLSKLKRDTYAVARQGDFDRAILLDRRYARIPGYGTPLEGPILFNAGRYPEARAFVKKFAFDEYGQPRLTSTELYTYALALENDGKEAEAQKLLDAAVAVPQRTAVFHVALATCLLSQKKEAARACELMEQAFATADSQSSGYGRTSDHLMRVARYAWALAASGRRQEAEAKIREAFAGSAELKPRDVAGLHYFTGEAWRALGEWKKARAAFDEAIKLSPDGSAATSTKKALAMMRVEAEA
jgi:hypothetical protein